MKQLKKSRKGFTLIELLTVIAIIGILAGLASAGIPMAMNKARQMVASNNLRSIAQAIVSIRNEGKIITNNGSDARKYQASDVAGFAEVLARYTSVREGETWVVGSDVDGYTTVPQHVLSEQSERRSRLPDRVAARSRDGRRMGRRRAVRPRLRSDRVRGRSRQIRHEPPRGRRPALLLRRQIADVELHGRDRREQRLRRPQADRSQRSGRGIKIPQPPRVPARKKKKKRVPATGARFFFSPFKPCGQRRFARFAAPQRPMETYSTPAERMARTS